MGAVPVSSEVNANFQLQTLKLTVYLDALTPADGQWVYFSSNIVWCVRRRWFSGNFSYEAPADFWLSICWVLQVFDWVSIAFCLVLWLVIDLMNSNLFVWCVTRKLAVSLLVDKLFSSRRRCMTRLGLRVQGQVTVAWRLFIVWHDWRWLGVYTCIREKCFGCFLGDWTQWATTQKFVYTRKRSLLPSILGNCWCDEIVCRWSRRN